jgi:hypothetical protein
MGCAIEQDCEDRSTIGKGDCRQGYGWKDSAEASVKCAAAQHLVRQRTHTLR